MKEYAQDLLDKYRRIGAIVDANLLLIYFLGLVDRNLISRCRGTEMERSPRR
jgi:hypothetical protein